MRKRVSTFHKRLKELRSERGVSTRELAEEINTTSATISRWENGKSPPTADDKLLDLADFFNVTVDYLLGCEE